MQYLEDNALQNLLAHKYSSATYSFADKILTPFWEWTVNLLPLWLAPNVITLLSLLHAVAFYAVFHYFCPTLNETAPSWAYVFFCYSLFMYQVLSSFENGSNQIH